MPIPTTNLKLSDIQSQFGGSNPVSMSEYYSTGTNVGVGQTGQGGSIPSSGTISASKFKNANSSWMLYTDTATATTNISYMCSLMDSQGNIYCAGYTYTSNIQLYTSYPKLLLNKFSAGGTLLWQYTFDPPQQLDDVRFMHMAFDPSGNIVISGNRQNSSTNKQSLLLFKFNTNGTILWQKMYTEAVSRIGLSDGLVVDTSGNIYVSVYRDFQGTDTYYYTSVSILKFDSSGTLVWQTGLYNNNLDNGTSSYSAQNLALDSSGNLYYYTTCHDTVDARTKAALVKFNSSGSIVWQRKLLGPTGSYLTSSSMKCDSSDNIFVIARIDGYQTSSIVKYNSSGTLQWQKLTGLVSNWGIDIDSSGNIYTMHSASGSTMNIAKFTSTPTSTYVRYIYHKTGGSLDYIFFNSMFYDDASDTIVMTGGDGNLGGGFGRPILVKFRQGYLGYIGTVESNSFGVSNLGATTISNGNYTDAAGTLSVQSQNYSASTPSYVAASSSFTVVKGVFGE
jgi:hypothetical protein